MRFGAYAAFLLHVTVNAVYMSLAVAHFYFLTLWKEVNAVS